VPVFRIGATIQEPRLRMRGIDASLQELKEAWQKPLRW
jgi:hypothetical protein